MLTGFIFWNFPHSLVCQYGLPPEESAVRAVMQSLLTSNTIVKPLLPKWFMESIFSQKTGLLSFAGDSSRAVSNVTLCNTQPQCLKSN